MDDFYLHSLAVSNVSRSECVGNKLRRCGAGFCVDFLCSVLLGSWVGDRTFFKGPVRTIDETLEESGEAREAVEAKIVKERDAEGSVSTEEDV
jgi:hypothetical protein